MKKNEYIKVGRLSKKIADAINKSAGDICITDATIKHIVGRHSAELGSMGMDAMGFVKFAVGNFTQILEDTHNKSLFLAYVPEQETAKVVVITITAKDDKYFVKTAFPMKSSYLKNKILIWFKE